MSMSENELKDAIRVFDRLVDGGLEDLAEDIESSCSIVCIVDDEEIPLSDYDYTEYFDDDYDGYPYISISYNYNGSEFSDGESLYDEVEDWKSKALKNVSISALAYLLSEQINDKRLDDNRIDDIFYKIGLEFKFPLSSMFLVNDAMEVVECNESYCKSIHEILKNRYEESLEPKRINLRKDIDNHIAIYNDTHEMKMTFSESQKDDMVRHFIEVEVDGMDYDEQWKAVIVESIKELTSGKERTEDDYHIFKSNNEVGETLDGRTSEMNEMSKQDEINDGRSDHRTDRGERS